MIFALGAETGPASSESTGAGAAGSVRLGPEATTRERLTAMVSENGPITAAELAESLGLTPAAVRRHLDVLADDGLVEEHEKVGATRRRGRPARAYVLTEAGHSELRDDYRDLASDVLRYLAEYGGDRAVHAFARERVEGFAGRLRRETADAGSLEQRVETLATALRREGFAASTRPVGEGTPMSGVQLCQGHCPVRDVAAEFPALCDAEAEMFSELLGVHVQRLATQAQGDHVCTTFIPLTTLGSAADAEELPRTPSATEKDTR